MTIGRPIKPIELDHEVKEHLQSITRSPRWKTGLKTLIFYDLSVSYSILVGSGTKQVADEFILLRLTQDKFIHRRDSYTAHQ